MTTNTSLNNESNSSITEINVLSELTSDPRTSGYWLISNGPIKVIVILSIYILFVKILGPKLMEKRPAFGLRAVLLIYNVSLVVINSYFFIKAIYYSNFGLRYFETKFPPENDFSDETLIKIHIIFYYWISKFMDLFDTVFFVLRKKSSQITFLHLYHHLIVPIFGYIAFSVRPNIPAVDLFMLVNSFIHIFMYSYYALSAIVPNYGKYLWWKKYLTLLQKLQFAFYGFYAFILSFYQTGYPIGLYCFTIMQIPFFYYLFDNFYRNSYTKSTKQKLL